MTGGYQRALKIPIINFSRKHKSVGPKNKQSVMYIKKKNVQRAHAIKCTIFSVATILNCRYHLRTLEVRLSLSGGSYWPLCRFELAASHQTVAGDLPVDVAPHGPLVHDDGITCHQVSSSGF